MRQLWAQGPGIDPIRPAHASANTSCSLGSMQLTGQKEPLVIIPRPALWAHEFLRGFPGEIWNWLPYSEGREGTKKEAGHSRLVEGRFNKQGELIYEACLGQLQNEQTSAAARRTFSFLQQP